MAHGASPHAQGRYILEQSGRTMATSRDYEGTKMAMDSPGMTSVKVEQEMEGLVAEAQMLLEKHQLDETEVLLQQVLQRLPDTHPKKESLAVSTLLGLSEIYAKKGRSRRYNLMEWYRLLMQAATFQEEAVVLCHKMLLETGGPTLPYLEETKNKATIQLDALEECLTNSIHENVRSTRASRRADQSQDELHNGWLKYLQTYCCETQGLNVKPDQAKSDLINANLPEYNEQKHTVVHRKINFDQVQNAIMTLVKEITADLRRRSWRKRLPEETLKRSLSFEMVNKLSPNAEHSSSDIISLFDNAIIYEEQDDSALPENVCDSSDEDDETFVNTEPYPMEILHSEVNSSLLKSYDQSYQSVINTLRHSTRTTHSMSSINTAAVIPKGIESKTRVSDQVIALSNLQPPHSGVVEYLPRSQSTIDTQRLQDKRVERSQSCPHDLDHRMGEVTSGPYKMPGVLTVWRSYRKPVQLQTYRKYTLNSFEEVSPLTETEIFFEGQDIVTDDNDDEDSDKYLDQSLLSSDRMKCTLAWMIAKAAEQISEEKRSFEALELFKFSLGLFQDIPPKFVNPNVIGNILKLVGVMKCDQGDIEGGIQLMEEAMTLLGADVEDSLDVAEVLYNMGNAYMDEQWRDASLFDHVMKLVKSDVDNDIQADLGLANLDDGDIPDDVSESECSDSGESYTVCTVEAMGCYKQALAILCRLNQHSEQHTSLYVDVITKLADCCIMVSDYDQAVLCYEEALELFSNAFGTKCLPKNAHVLSMLGTANYLLANYPKAVTMYETANILQQHLQDTENKSFGPAFNLTMIGITFYTMQQYQKCILWCLKAYEAFKGMFPNLVSLGFLKRWFIVQTLYTLGFSFSTLSMKYYGDALYYLDTSKDLLKKVKAEDRDSKQMIRVLKAMADVYTTLDDHDNALQCYTEALEESHKLGDENTVTALQNQLLNKIAVVHVTNKHYGTAADFLEKALDYQKNVQTSIRGDLLGMMHQLGTTYTLSGDIDKAIECYQECFETCQDLHGAVTPEITNTLCNLAILYHVKACIQEDGDDAEEELLRKAHQCYQEALRLNPKSEVNIQYANFLYQQGQSGDALLTMLPLLHGKHTYAKNWLVYNGLQQAVLPDHLQDEMADTDEGLVQIDVFADYLAILCYKQLLLTKDAEDCLIHMYERVLCSSFPLNYSILGYSLMELNLPEEAAESFLHAARLQESKELSLTNFSICVYLWLYNILSAGFYSVWTQMCDYPMVSYVNNVCVTVNNKVKLEQAPITLTVYPSGEFATSRGFEDGMFDSGYGDDNLCNHKLKPLSPKSETVAEEEEEPVTSSSILTAVRKRMKQRIEGDESEENTDFLTAIRLEGANRFSTKLSRYSSHKNDNMSESGYSEPHDQWNNYETVDSESPDTEEWITEEVVSVDTPQSIVDLMRENGPYVFGADLNKADIDPDWGLHSQITVEENLEYEEWVTTEEVIDTPLEVLQQLKEHWRSGTKDVEEDDEEEEEEEEEEDEERFSEEEGVELPQEILQQILQQQGSRIPWRTSSVGSSDEPSTCELPKEVTDFLQEQAQRLNMSQSEEVPKEEVITERGPSSSHSGWYTRWSSNRKGEEYPLRETALDKTEVLNALNGNSPPLLHDNQTEEEDTWVTSEETVEAPPELLAILLQQQQRR